MAIEIAIFILVHKVNTLLGPRSSLSYFDENMFCTMNGDIIYYELCSSVYIKYFFS